MHAPVCIKCETEFKPKENGIGLLDMADYGPVQIWEADLWECPGCGTQIVSGIARVPIFEHYQDGFEEFLARKEAMATVIRNYPKPQGMAN